MGFALSSFRTSEMLLPPPPPDDSRWDERDRFGLPVYPPSLLAESAEERRARTTAVERLATDLFQTAVTHLGRPEARHLFAEVAKAPWNKGKQPNRERNQKLLEMYDNAVAWDRTRLCSGAPRSIKMGTTRSPCPYDAAARHALQSARL